MEPTLVYDAATMSTLPLQAACMAGLLAAVAATLWLLRRPGGLRTWFTGAALVMAVVSVAAVVEQRQIADATDLRLVEGPVVHPSEWRTRRAGSKHNDYSRWQGFWIGDVGFSYALDATANYFSNAEPHHVDLREGLLLRVHYREQRDGDVVQRHIVRVERLPQ